MWGWCWALPRVPARLPAVSRRLSAHLQIGLACTGDGKTCKRCAHLHDAQQEAVGQAQGGAGLHGRQDAGVQLGLFNSGDKEVEISLQWSV